MILAIKRYFIRGLKTIERYFIRGLKTIKRYFISDQTLLY